MEKIKVAIIRNPFDPLGSREVREFDAGLTVGRYMQEFIPVPVTGIEFAVAVNGRLIEHTDFRGIVLNPGDSLSFCAVPQGGGDDGGKNPLAIVAMIAVTIIATIAQQHWVTAGLWGGKIGGVVVYGAIMAAGGLIVNSIFPSEVPGFDGMGRETFEQSQTYGWNTQDNVADPGQPLPVLYGTHRVIPPLVARYVETVGDKQYLNLLYAVAGHVVDNIHTIEINDQGMDKYQGVRHEISLGGNWQTPFSMFEDQRSDVMINAKISTAWTVRTTGECDRFGVGFVAPQGLWAANDKGGLDRVTLKIEAEYRKLGAATWREWLGHESYKAGDDFRSRDSSNIFTTDTHNLATRLQTGAMIQSYVGGTPYAEHTVNRVKLESFTIRTRIPCPEGRGDSYSSTTYPYSEIRVSGPALPANMTSYDYANPYNLRGKQNSPKRWFFEVPSPKDGYARYEYRTRFIEDPPSGTRYGSDLFVSHHQEIIAEALEYPNTAMLAVRALATDQLSGGRPRVSCIAECTTADIDGTARRIDNPAWACVHMLQDTLNGGGVDINKVDVSDFEAWADNCDDNNLTCNIYFDSSMNLKRALDTIGMLGRGQVIQLGSDYTCITDFPDVAVQHFVFGMGNIVENSFSEEWISQTDRADEIEVSYWDAANSWNRELITIQQEGYDQSEREPNKQTITLYGCTSRSMAAKHAKFLLQKNRYLTLTASWTADIDALACRFGDVVKVSHDLPQWGYSGRVVSAEAEEIVLDREVVLVPDTTYALEIKYSDDTTVVKQVHVVTTQETDEIIPDTPFVVVPEKYDIWTFGVLNRQSKKFKIMSITKDSALKRRIQALEYVPEVYMDTVNVPALPPSELFLPQAFQASEVWVAGPDGAGRSVVDLSWRGGDALLWRVWLRGPDSEWKQITETYDTEYRIETPFTIDQTYDIAVSFSGPQFGAQTQIQIKGKLAPPNEVTNFFAVQSGGEIVLHWDHIPDIDLWGYEIREGVDWNKGRIIVDGVQENRAVYKPTKKGDHKFWIKSIDNSEIYSTDAVSYDLTVLFFKELNVVLDYNEIPAQVPSATLSNFALDETDKLIWLPCATDVNFSTSNDTDPALSGYAGDRDMGEYISQVYDLSAVVNFTLRIDTEFTSILPGATDLSYPNRTDLTYPLDTDQALTSLSVPLMYFRLSDDDIIWGAWRNINEPVDVIGRYFQIKTITDIDTDSVNFVIDQIATTADVPDKVADLENEAIPDTGKTFNLVTDFDLTILVKYIVSVQTLGSIARYPVIDKSTNTFDLYLFDQTGSGIAGNVDITVRGY